MARNFSPHEAPRDRTKLRTNSARSSAAGLFEDYVRPSLFITRPAVSGDTGGRSASSTGASPARFSASNLVLILSAASCCESPILGVLPSGGYKKYRARFARFACSLRRGFLNDGGGVVVDVSGGGGGGGAVGDIAGGGSDDASGVGASRGGGGAGASDEDGFAGDGFTAAGDGSGGSPWSSSERANSAIACEVPCLLRRSAKARTARGGDVVGLSLRLAMDFELGGEVGRLEVTTTSAGHY